MADILAGYDSEGWEWFCEDVYNYIKNHWRMSDPCSNLDGLTAGMIVSDSDDDKLYHAILASGCTCSEIVQTCVPVSDDKYVTWGDTNYGEIGFNTTNNALMIGIPLDPNYGMIICEDSVIADDMTGLLAAVADVSFYIVDADKDSFIWFGFIADDTPSLETGGADSGLNIQNAGEKLGFFDTAPVVQQGPIADATGAGDVVLRVNDIIAALENYGLLST